jgi:hypothetical protein
VRWFLRLGVRQVGTKKEKKNALDKLTAARTVFVPDCARVDDMECASETLWRDVDVAVARQGCGRNPEQLLAYYPGNEKIGYFAVELAHDVLD